MGLYLFLLILGSFYVLSYIIEISHLEDLEKREQYYRDKVIVNNLRKISENINVKEVFLCVGNVVIGANYYKRFIASLKQLIGGHLKGFEMIIERAYREALLRLVEKAYHNGADMVINVRFETVCLGRTNRRGKVNSSMLEVLAYGTAIKTG